MLRSLKQVKDLKIHAFDGEIGSVDYFFFDDEGWAIRYFVINTGNWLTGRQVLISPYSVNRVDWIGGDLFLSLTKEQVQGSPDIDVLRPISRQNEVAFMNYYDYPFYWGSTEVAGMLPPPQLQPRAESVAQAASASTQTSRSNPDNPDVPTDSHLRSTQTVSSYPIAATDGDLGHVEDFIVDDEIWAIRYLVIATRTWWPGKKVLVAPQWIESVDWRDSKVHVNLTREAIKGSPEFSESALISREYENQLYRYYGHPPYWNE